MSDRGEIYRARGRICSSLLEQNVNIKEELELRYFKQRMQECHN